MRETGDQSSEVVNLNRGGGERGERILTYWERPSSEEQRLLITLITCPQSGVILVSWGILMGVNFSIFIFYVNILCYLRASS